MVAGSTAGSPAGLCVNYRGGGMTDWFLPAVDQLNMLDNVLYQVNMILEGDGSPATTPINFGGVNDYYWSSTEMDADGACGFKYVAVIAFKFKDTYRVRAVRAF
jgi:hypothetical protein